MSSQRFAAIGSAARVGSIVILSSLAIGPSAVIAQGAPRPERTSDEPTPIASTRSIDASSNTPSIAVKAVPRIEGTPSPGLRVTLDATSSTGGRMWYRWLQTQGPKVAIDDPTKPETGFTVPSDASTLGFVLVVGNGTGIDARPLAVEIEDPEREGDLKILKADAGDDQSGSVGRRIVLNGVRSEPKGKVRFRWVQTGGPKVSLKAGEGPTATFLPATAGTYQFALIVSTTGGVMSDPSMVKVTIGSTVRASNDSSSMAIDELARVSIASIDGGTRYVDDLSKAFDGAAEVVESQRSFTDAIADLTRRLDAIVPREKERRAVWIDQLLTPLMAKLVTGMKAGGLDLNQPTAQSRALTRDQKARLADQFRYTAAGLRASKTLR